MPISSGAGGKAARLHLPAVATKRSYWLANVRGASRSRSTSTISIVNSVNESLRPQHQSHAKLRKIGGGNLSSLSSWPSLAESLATGPQQKRNHAKLPATKKRTRGPAAASSKQQQDDTNKSPGHEHQRLATVEKYKRIRHISPPSSHATTSPTAFKYFAANQDQEREPAAQSRADHADQTRAPSSQVSSFAGQQHHKEQLAPSRGHFDDVLTTTSQKQGSKTARKSGLFGALMALGGGSIHRAATRFHSSNANNNDHSRPTMNRFGHDADSAGHYASATSTTTTAIDQHPAQAASQTSLNPSLSPSGGALAASTSGSSAHLHSLSSLHHQPSATTINKRIHLKYVKTLVIALMSLDLLITVLVHQFASHDEFSLIFTSHKLRLSSVNLILSAIWFIVLISAILFDIYFILLVGCMVDVASFVLLLTCAVVHFTNRIDYNTVNLTSLLLLLFAITVLHVYLLVIAALTIYLALAVKRRRKH